MSIKAPQFLVDVFRDLRDRRLLIPAVALLAGLVAVPMLLGRSEEAPPPPLAPSGDVALEGLATQPAVLADSLTVRDYKQRLDRLSDNNPFERHFSVPASAAGAGLEDEGGGVEVGGTEETSSAGVTGTTGTTDTTGTIDSTSTDSTSPGTVTSTPSSGSDGSSGSSGSDGSSGNSGSGDGDGNGNSAEPPPPITRYYTYKIDVLVGPLGDATLRTGVGQLRILPGLTRPVVAYLGATDDGKKALFSVSDEVAATSGDGNCIPTNSNCEYLLMSEGDDRTFDYTPNGTTYRLKLKRIHSVELKDAAVPVP